MSQLSENRSEWNEEQDEVLVDFVQQKQDLWDKKRFNYRNTKLKEQIFVKLDNQLRKPHGSSEKRFKKLREKFRRHIEYIDKVSRSGRELQEPRSSWHLAKKMEFMRGTFNRRSAHTDSLRKKKRNIQQSSAKASQSVISDSSATTLSAEDVPNTSSQIYNQRDQANSLSPRSLIEISSMEIDQNVPVTASVARSPENCPEFQAQPSPPDFRSVLNQSTLPSSVARSHDSESREPISLPESRPADSVQTGNIPHTEGRPSLTASRMKLAMYEEGMNILSTLSENAALVNGILKEEEKTNFRSQVEMIFNGFVSNQQ